MLGHLNDLTLWQGFHDHAFGERLSQIKGAGRYLCFHVLSSSPYLFWFIRAVQVAIELIPPNVIDGQFFPEGYLSLHCLVDATSQTVNFFPGENGRAGTFP
jgi:hypothetical protein